MVKLVCGCYILGNKWTNIICWIAQLMCFQCHMCTYCSLVIIGTQGYKQTSCSPLPSVETMSELDKDLAVRTVCYRLLQYVQELKRSSNHTTLVQGGLLATSLFDSKS